MPTGVAAANRLWLGAVLRQIAKVPAGERLRLGDMARTLDLTQAQVIASIEILITEGRLDAGTLRPPRQTQQGKEETWATGSNSRSDKLSGSPSPARKAKSSDGPNTPPASGNITCATAPATGDSAKAGGAKALSPDLTDRPRRTVPIAATGPQLYRLLLEEGQRRGMHATAVSRAVFGNQVQMSIMKIATRPVREATRLKAEAWLNSPGAAPAERRVPLGDRRFRENKTPPGDAGTQPGGCEGADSQANGAAPSPSRPSLPTGDELANRLAAWCDRHGLSRTRVGKHLFGRPGSEHLRGTQPKRPKVERIEALLASPPLPEWSKAEPKGSPQGSRRAEYCQLPGACVAPHKGRCSRCQPYQRRSPDLTSELQRAAARRSIGRQAQAILDGDKSARSTGGRIAQSVRAAMNLIEERRGAEARAADPIEQAKLALRKRGRVVFDASVDGGRKGRFFVSGQTDPVTGKRKQLTPQELTALAWKVNPLAMQEITGSEANAS
jgi:hypothetical protein